MFLEYGLDKHGEMIHIDQAQRGLGGLICPYCSGQLIARKGSEKIHHFAHAGETCREVAGRDESAFKLPVYDKFDLGLSQKELVVLFRNHYFGLVRAEKGKSINDSKYGALYMQYFDKANELISYRDDIEERLKNKGFLAWNDFVGRDGDYQFTQLGKVPVGAATLEKFAQIQDRQFTDRHKELLNAVESAWIYQGKKPERLNIALIDLNIYRAQLRRVFAASLYFLEIKHSGGILYKIGVTNRPIEERTEEINRALIPHLSGAKITVLRQLRHRGAIEFYFKHRYRHEQHKLGSLTEYFLFEDRKPILSDLSRLGDYEPDDFMLTILRGEPSQTERDIETERHSAAEKEKRQIIRELHGAKTKEGMSRAAAAGIHIGRPKDGALAIITKYPEIVTMLKYGVPIKTIERETGVAKNTIKKVRDAVLSLAKPE